jgi:hypothetical protein
VLTTDIAKIRIGNIYSPSWPAELLALELRSSLLKEAFKLRFSKCGVIR